MPPDRLFIIRLRRVTAIDLPIGDQLKASTHSVRRMFQLSIMRALKQRACVGIDEFWFDQIGIPVRPRSDMPFAL